MSEYEIWTIILQGIALIIAVGGGWLALRTLQTIIAQLKAAQWNSLLSFEQDMADRRKTFVDIAMNLNMSSQPDKILQGRFDEAKQSYFNSLDRLASSILNGQFPDSEMRQDYRDIIKDTIRENQQDFNTGTSFRKVVKLYNKWEDGK